MILGTGIDIVEIKRIEKSLLLKDSFASRIFTDTEIAYCEAKTHSGESYAGRFAVKEAFFKALGTGWRGELKFSEVGVVNNDLGAPEVVVTGEAARIVEHKQITKIHASISHSDAYAIAQIILER